MSLPELTDEKRAWYILKGYEIQESLTGRSYLLNGKVHREDGPAIEYADGSKKWCLNGEHHRHDGPAYEGASGTKQWWINNTCHREDGPAIEWSDGTREWLLNGKYFYSEKEHRIAVQKLREERNNAAS